MDTDSFPRRPLMHWEKLHDTPSSSSASLQPYPQPRSKETEKIDNSGKYHKMKSRSFADLAEVFGFGNKVARPSSRLSEILPRPKSSASLERRSSYTKRRYVPHHLPTNVIIRILSFCSDDVLLNCLTVSRLFFNLAGTILYQHLTLESPKDMWDRLVGSTLLYENTTGKISIGRRRFKDRLLRHTESITLHSHGDDDGDCQDSDSEEPEDYFGNLKKLSILSHSHSRNSSSSSIFSFGKRSNPTTPILITPPPPPAKALPISCPPVPLNGVMPRLSTLRIILADAYDYHLLFCPRFGSACPLLEGLELERLIIIGARSPLVVLPTAFPSTTIETSSPMGLTATVTRHTPTPTTTSPALASPPMMGHINTVSTKIKSSGGLPIGLSELTIVLPTGRSYDSKDYEGYRNIFHYKKTLESISKLTIVFLTSPTSHGRSTQPEQRNRYWNGDKQSLWQVAFYSSRNYNPTWTSYLCLAEDLAKACLAVPLETTIEIVGMENIDGELLNMGIGTMKERGKSGMIMQERIKRQIEVRLIASNKEYEVNTKNQYLKFRDLDDWLDCGEGRRQLGEKGYEELGKEGYREFR
ncbi:hypothetical protein V865_005821 [Kwoniella europaea PYCC6329]|uniref:F-box domain-containing protein n=1 Tax=Kwoniella europaea PYCC6329 TaxID=1423913 RepID=A0AAX4KP26_9TREE